MLPGSSTSLTALFSRLWKSFKTTGMCSRRHGEVVLEVRRLQKTDISSYQQKEQAHHSSAGGKSVSCCLRKADLPKNCCQTFEGGGLYARRPVVCVPLTRQHRTARLQWCREHHNWTEQDWACVLFSDESRFSLSSDCRRQLIWLESGTAYRPENIQEKDRYPTCSIMVWAGIMINGRTRLHVVTNGTMTGQRYIDEVLLPHVRLFRGAVGRSPDLNPIENVWDALGRQVVGRSYPPTNKNTLIRALTEEWDKLPQQLLDNVVQSMVYPINHATDETVNTASLAMVERHAHAFPSEFIRQQRHILRAVPLGRVQYAWKQKQGEFYVYGFQKKVYFEDYPQKCICCTCC
ncbi:DDE_3 domain-containing protein [Trichonephila clavipes]|uniref:DDE_3 domain-containing protein n=1 Tax=Trichonephila clavipes TaxID=2585209 RepID=A0A8X6R3M8_TRICX|nr:DDE_3 domain-containing protein [Trichonephila clavipes]